MAREFSGNRMTKQWSGIASGATGMTGAATILVTSFTATEAFTVLRMLGEYIIGPTPGGTFADGDHVEVGIGIGVVSGDAIAAGSGSMPDPVDEPDYPWLFRRTHKFLLSSGLILNPSEMVTVRSAFDSRSMRKLKSREGFAVVVQYVDIVGAPPMTFSSGFMRFLAAS